MVGYGRDDLVAGRLQWTSGTATLALIELIARASPVLAVFDRRIVRIHEVRAVAAVVTRL